MNSFDDAKKILLDDNDLDFVFLENTLTDLKNTDIDFADLYFAKVMSESLSLDESIVKGGSYSISKGVGVRSVLGEKSGFAYSNIIDKNSILNCKDAVSSIAHGYRGNASFIRDEKRRDSLYTNENPLNSISKAKKAEILLKIDNIARSLDNRVIQVMASINAAFKVVFIVNTDGTMASDIKPVSQLVVNVIVSANGKTESGFAARGGAFLLTEFSDDVIESVTKEALRIALVNLEAIEAPAGQMPVILGSGWPGVLIHEAVGHGLEGDFNRIKSSIYSDKLGQKVASSACTIIDDGTFANRKGSLTYDDEGIETQENVLIENGILKNYMLDRQNAMLMKMKPTGNGRRQAYNYLPQVRMTNTYLKAGDYTKEEILSSVKDGIYAVNFSGGQVDITSGNFVFSTSEAYLIKDGKIDAPIKGATLIGNGPEIMHQVSMVGNDLEFDPGIGTCGKGGQSVAVGIGQPTLKIDSITVGGTKV